MEKIECTRIRDIIMQDASNNINHLAEKLNHLPKLVVIQVEGDEASDRYIRSKKRACEQLGVEFEHIKLPNNVRYPDLRNAIIDASCDSTSTGVMLQLPLPSRFDDYKQELIDLINPLKDVDGLTTTNKGKPYNNRLVLKPCTAMGIARLIEWKDNVSAPDVCIVGRSDLIGKPLVDILSTKFNATVTLCHSKTKNLKKHTSQADIVVLATGQAKMFDKTCFRDDAFVIDAGIERDNDGKLCGDADSSTFLGTGIKFTPVPGGVGLLTVAQLMDNLSIAYYLNG